MNVKYSDTFLTVAQIYKYLLNAGEMNFTASLHTKPVVG